MHFTFAIPIAMAAIVTALPQGPGGSRAILGWCVSIWPLPSKYSLRTIETNHHSNDRLRVFKDVYVVMNVPCLACDPQGILLMHYQGYNSLWDCTSRGGKSYSYCVSRVAMRTWHKHISVCAAFLLKTLLDNQGMQNDLLDRWQNFSILLHFGSFWNIKNKRQEVDIKKICTVPLREQARTTKNNATHPFEFKSKPNPPSFRATSIGEIRG